MITVSKQKTIFNKIWKITDAVLAGGVFLRELCKADSSIFPFSEELKAEDPKLWQRRKDSLIDGAAFFPVASNTLVGYSGQAFSRPYLLNLPTKLEVLESDIDAAGTTFEQQLKQAFIYAMAYNFGGLLIDFFKPDGVTQVSVNDLASRKAGAAIRLIAPGDIIDWAYENKNGNKILTYIKLRFLDEQVKDLADFKRDVVVEENERFLDIRLIEGKVYHASRMTIDGQEIVKPLQEFKNSSGANLGYIPFTFFGADTNKGFLSVAEFYKLIDLNLAHFRSSADFDEAAAVAGQGSIVLAGITEEWNREVLKGKIGYGVRRYIPLNEGASASMLQLAPNILAFESMKHKENQMLAIGARLAERTSNSLEKTATEVKSGDNYKGSVLSNCIGNLQVAYLWAFTVAGEYVGDTKIKEDFLKLNTNFNIEKLTLEERHQLVSEWQAKVITVEELRETLKDAGFLIQDLPQFLADFKSGQSFEFLNTTKEETQNGVKK